MLLVSGLGAQSYGAVLVYNMFGMVQTVDTAANDGDTQMVNGFLVMDVNEETGAAEASSLVLYGRAGWQNKVYTIYDDVVSLTEYGNFVAVTIDTGNGDSIILTGRIRTRGRGNELAASLGAASSLSGAMSLQEGRLFEVNESLVGAGAMQASLNNRMTRTANVSPDLFGETVDSIIANLEARGFQVLMEEEPQMPN